MKIWIDDVRPAPGTLSDGWIWIQEVNAAKEYIAIMERGVEKGYDTTIELIDIDHDAGKFASEGGDYIKLLDWLEETGRNYPIHIHSMNPVGVQNMRAIIQRNDWKEIR
jgi:hypothetical protein